MTFPNEAEIFELLKGDEVMLNPNLVRQMMGLPKHKCHFKINGAHQNSISFICEPCDDVIFVSRPCLELMLYGIGSHEDHCVYGRMTGLQYGLLSAHTAFNLEYIGRTWKGWFDNENGQQKSQPHSDPGRT